MSEPPPGRKLLVSRHSDEVAARSIIMRQQAQIVRRTYPASLQRAQATDQPPSATGTKRPVELISKMWGIGDNLMHRAVVRELMKTHDIYLTTHSPAMYQDFVEDGLKFAEIKPGPRIRETLAAKIQTMRPPNGAEKRFMDYGRLTGNNIDILVAGSPLAAMFASVGLEMPTEPDFSFRIPAEWRDRAQDLISTWDLGAKPLMIYRPIILNTPTFWRRPTRSPDVGVYAALFETIREQFFTVSVANIGSLKEEIVGEMPRVDKDFNNGELDFETMAGLFAAADLVFGNAGFVPILAHATRTPVVIVYGGHESFLTTDCTAQHLSPTLAIDPDKPCDCHTDRHQCDKTITVAPAKARLLDFVDRVVSKPVGPDPRVLIFATTYIKNDARRKLLDQWLTMTIRRNPNCDILLVDTPPSPTSYLSIDPKHGAFLPYTPGLATPRMAHRFPDNVGHLLERAGPTHRDGWGRGFCFGLQAAIDGGYDYAVHIEGDSLFRFPCVPIIRQMQRHGWDAVSTLSVPGRTDMIEIETALMFFKAGYVRESNFIANYNWPSLRTSTPSPENIIYRLLGEHLHLMPWRAERQHGQLTPESVVNMDWITWADPEIYDNFAAGRLLRGKQTPMRPQRGQPFQRPAQPRPPRRIHPSVLAP